MKSFTHSVLLWCFYLVVNAERKIYGGWKVKNNEFPYMALIALKNKDNKYAAVCGGSIINNQWVLTAAHCFSEELLPTLKDSELFVKVGSDSLSKNTGVWRRVKSVKYIPEYNPDDLPLNDIALVNVSGWGLVEKTKRPSEHLKKINLTLISESQCNESWPNEQGNLRLCAASGGNTGTCGGDSGGPLVLKEPVPATSEVIGVLSYGNENCAAGDFEIYTRVQDYITWIKDTMEGRKSAWRLASNIKHDKNYRNPHFYLLRVGNVLL